LKALLQRVNRASVSVDGTTIGSIDSGLLVLLGVAVGDTQKEARYLAEKTVNLRIFSDSDGKFNLSALDIQSEILVVSQFTLLADARKGRRPSFTDAAPPEIAAPLCEYFMELMRGYGLKVASGVFGAHMTLDIVNDGPVTIMLDSSDKRGGL
jgi:D-aminoacyl-tRNA deacylase